MKAKNGNTFTAPRHGHDLGNGLSAKIIKQAGVKMSVTRFHNAKRPGGFVRIGTLSWFSLK